MLLYQGDDRKLTIKMIPMAANPFKPRNTSKRLCITKSADGVTIADSTAQLANSHHRQHYGR